MRAVGFDRRRAHREQIGDLLITMPLRDELEDLPLALRQRIVSVDDPLVRKVTNVIVEHHGRNGGTEERLAGSDRAHSPNQIGGSRILQQIPAPACSACVMYASSACMLRINRPTDGRRRTIWRVASMPFRSGMPISRMTTSG